MNPDKPTQDNYNQPVAYDVDGRPLYAHPPSEANTQTVAASHEAPAQPPAQRVVHIARAAEPVRQEVSDELKKKHARSARIYPTLNLSDNEYVITAVRRHPIGLVIPLTLGALIITIVLILLSNYPAIVEALQIDGQLAQTSAVAVPMLLFSAFIALGMFVSYYVYINNKFYLTNESVIQEVQLSLFSRHEQTVSLGNVEDASYYQAGVLQDIFNYGTIRLSTQGDETTYTFRWTSNPKSRIAILNNAVESFKNGRPVGT